jgi:hypothetical protein
MDTIAPNAKVRSPTRSAIRPDPPDILLESYPVFKSGTIRVSPTEHRAAARAKS